MSSVDRIECLRSQGKRDRQMDGLEINAKRRVFEKRTFRWNKPGWAKTCVRSGSQCFLAILSGFGRFCSIVNGHTDVWTDGWTHPLIEMRGRNIQRMNSKK